MSRELSESEIIDIIKKDLLLDQLDLSATGLTLEQIRDDEPLLSDDGLALDSVDALDLLVSVEKKFGLKIPNMDKPFIDANCQTVRTLAMFVFASLGQGDGRKQVA